LEALHRWQAIDSPMKKALLDLLSLIPVISYLTHRGKCNKCGKPISIIYPLTEILTGLLFALTWYFSKDYNHYIITLQLIICLSLIIISITDILSFTIPDEMQIILAIAGLANSYLFSHQFIKIAKE
jgi:prepilin signal peptidase PulO-like enzyme (type II secretory pathway)